MNHPMHAPADGPEAMMDRTVIVRVGGFDAENARHLFPALRELERTAALLARDVRAFEIEAGRAAATHIGDRSYRTGGGTLAVRREDDAVLVQERAGPGHVHFGTRRHELSLRYTDRAVPDRELVAMPEFGARTAIAARIAMAACRRVESGDRVIDEADAIALMDAAEDRLFPGLEPIPVRTPLQDRDRISFASPWAAPFANHGGVRVPTSVHARHWAMREGVRLLVIGDLARFTLVDPVVRTRGAGTKDPVARMRRHQRDVELRRRFADWGLCTPPSADGEDAA